MRRPNQGIVRQDQGKLRQATLERDGHKCRRCGWSDESLSGVGLDTSHTIALHRGGADSLENTATLCIPCHYEWQRAEKQGTPFGEWVQSPAPPRGQDDPPTRRKPGEGTGRRGGKKLLITLTDEQEDWLRKEAERLDLPGGVSELMRRIIDAYQGAK